MELLHSTIDLHTQHMNCTVHSWLFYWYQFYECHSMKRVEPIPLVHHSFTVGDRIGLTSLYVYVSEWLHFVLTYSSVQFTFAPNLMTGCKASTSPFLAAVINLNDWMNTCTHKSMNLYRKWIIIQRGPASHLTLLPPGPPSYSTKG